MIYPKEHDEVVRELRAIIGEQNRFKVVDCITRFGFGKHNSEDWAECADELVAKGELAKTGDYHEYYKVVKKEETVEIPKVYKALCSIEGKLESLTAMGATLSYKEGQVTYAPKYSMGIFVDDTFEDARDSAKNNGSFKTSKGAIVVIHEAVPLGDSLSREGKSLFSDFTRYPALLLGKEVWRDKPKEPVEEWVDVTKECSVEVVGANSKYHIQVSYRGVYLLGLGGTYGALTIDPEYKVDIDPNEGCLGKFTILKRVIK